MLLDIVTLEYGPHSEVLLEVAQEVSFPLSKEDQKFIEDLKETFLSIHGVGLAAPQVGVARQIIVYQITPDAAAIRKEASPQPLQVFINPNYEPTKDAQLIQDWEGCFSVATKMGKVPRYNKIHLTAFTPEGQKISQVVEGFTARVLQHEIDHVQGFLMTHRLTEECLQGSHEEMMQYRIQEMNLNQLQTIKQMIEKDQLSVPEPSDRHKTLAETLALVNSRIQELS